MPIIRQRCVAGCRRKRMLSRYNPLETTELLPNIGRAEGAELFVTEIEKLGSSR